MLWRFQGEPLRDSGTNLVLRVALDPCDFEETGDQPVKVLIAIDTAFAAGITDKETAPFSPFYPSPSDQFAVRGTYGIGMDLKSHGQLSGARQTFTWSQVGTDD